jgi:hypothetical protein
VINLQGMKEKETNETRFLKQAFFEYKEAEE